MIKILGNDAVNTSSEAASVKEDLTFSNLFDCIQNNTISILLQAFSCF